MKIQDQFKTLKVDLLKSVGQSSHAGRHVDIRPSFVQGIRSDVIAKPIGETVSVSTRNLSFEDNTVITSVPRQGGILANAIQDMSTELTLSRIYLQCIPSRLLIKSFVRTLYQTHGPTDKAMQTVSMEKQTGIWMLKELIPVVIDSIP